MKEIAVPTATDAVKEWVYDCATNQSRPVYFTADELAAHASATLAVAAPALDVPAGPSPRDLDLAAVRAKALTDPAWAALLRLLNL